MKKILLGLTLLGALSFIACGGISQENAEEISTESSSAMNNAQQQGQAAPNIFYNAEGEPLVTPAYNAQVTVNGIVAGTCTLTLTGNASSYTASATFNGYSIKNDFTFNGTFTSTQTYTADATSINVLWDYNATLQVSGKYSTSYTLDLNVDLTTVLPSTINMVVVGSMVVDGKTYNVNENVSM